MVDTELFEQARRRVQKKIKGRCVTNKDVIVDQEKEIMYYREKIRKMMDSLKNKKELDKEFEIKIKDEDYIIKYNSDADKVMLNTYLVKLVNEKDIYGISKDNEFKIVNKTRYNKRMTIIY